LKVLFITRMTSGTGGMVVLSELARGLTARGHDVEMAAFRPSGTDSFPDGAALYSGINVVFIDVPKRDTESAQADEQVTAATDYLKQNHLNYDRILVDSWYIMLAAALAQVLTLPHVFHLAQRDPIFEPDNDSAVWKAKLFQLMGVTAAQRIIVGRSLTRILNERTGYDYPSLDVFVNDAYREGEFTIRDHNPLAFVASAANFNLAWKGLPFLLEQLERFSARPFELTLVASTPIDHDLKRYSFPIKVIHAETPVALRNILLEQDAYLCASSNESFCLALAEAVTLGMPSVALDSVGNRDYFTGHNFLFAKTPSEFLQLLNEVSNPQVRKRLHDASRPSMAAYTSSHMTEQFCKAFGI
jgi:hypothetical protein